MAQLTTRNLQNHRKNATVYPEAGNIMHYCVLRNSFLDTQEKVQTGLQGHLQRKQCVSFIV